MDPQNIFGDIVNDSFKIENLYDTPAILIEEPRIDILKLKYEFSNVYLSNEIYYTNKFMMMNKELVFKEQIINDLNTKLRVSVDLIKYYREKYNSLLKQSVEDRLANTKIVERFLKRKKQ